MRKFFVKYFVLNYYMSSNNGSMLNYSRAVVPNALSFNFMAITVMLFDNFWLQLPGLLLFVLCMYGTFIHFRNRSIEWEELDDEQKGQVRWHAPTRLYFIGKGIGDSEIYEMNRKLQYELAAKDGYKKIRYYYLALIAISVLLSIITALNT